MRTALIVFSAALLFTLGLQSFAQTSATQPGAWSGTDPRKIQFKTIDTSKAMKPPNTSKAFHAMSPTTGPNVNHFFPKLSLGSWPPKTANVSVLDQKKNVYQPKPVGVNPFDMGKKK